MDIETLLSEASAEPGLRPLFYKTLLQAELIVLTDKANDTGARVLKENEKVRFLSLSDGSLPAFTSTQRIFDGGVVKNEVPFMSLNAKALFEITAGTTIVLNPFSDHAKEFTPAEIQQLLSGRLSDGPQVQEIKKETHIRIGQPAHFLKEMENSIVTYCKTQPMIEAAFIAMMQDVDSGESPNLVLGIKISGDEEMVFNELSEVVKVHLKPDEHIDFIKISDDDDLGLSGYFKTIHPFYSRF
jgi:hypothetical protein